jgi:hypothetical protein
MSLKVLAAKAKVGQKLYQSIGFPFRMWCWEVICDIIVASDSFPHKSISSQYCQEQGGVAL